VLKVPLNPNQSINPAPRVQSADGWLWLCVARWQYKSGDCRLSVDLLDTDTTSERDHQQHKWSEYIDRFAAATTTAKAAETAAGGNACGDTTRPVDAPSEEDGASVDMAAHLTPSQQPVFLRRYALTYLLMRHVFDCCR